MSGFQTNGIDISNVYQTSSQILNLINDDVTSDAYTKATTANTTANSAKSTADSANTTADSAKSTADSVRTRANTINNRHVSNAGSNMFFNYRLEFNTLSIRNTTSTTVGTQGLYTHLIEEHGSTLGGNADKAYYILTPDSSSIKTKTNVHNINLEESAQIHKMRPVKYNLKRDLSRECIGFIAEEMIELEPRVVVLHNVNGVEESARINYEHLVPLLVAEIKHLKNCADELNERVKNMKKV